MPYAKCPHCETLFHILVTNGLEEWHEGNAPGVPRDQPAPVLCFECWKQARAGALDLEALAVSPEVMASLRRSVTDEPK